MIDIQQIFDGTISAAGVATGVAITNTRVSTNVLDFLVARDMGIAGELELHVQVLTALTGATSLKINLEVGATDVGTFYSIIESPVIPVAQLIAGVPIFRYRFPPNEVLNATAGVLNAPGRYARLNYTVVGTFGAGTVFSYLNAAPDRQQINFYPTNYNAYTGP